MLCRKQIRSLGDNPFHFSLQKLLSDERFVTMETDSDDKQLLNQMLNAVRVTPYLNEDLQVEVMKVSVPWTSVLA